MYLKENKEKMKITKLLPTEIEQRKAELQMQLQKMYQ